MRKCTEPTVELTRFASDEITLVRLLPRLVSDEITEISLLPRRAQRTATPAVRIRSSAKCVRLPNDEHCMTTARLR